MPTGEELVAFGPDEIEAHRLRLNHVVYKYAYGKLILADVDLTASELDILDVGCADGTWLQDVQDDFPSHNYVGVDINPNFFPKKETKDQRSHFKEIQHLKQDVTKPWPESFNNSYDVIHQRLMFNGLGPFPLRTTIRNLIAMTKPGGWIQLDEMDLPKVYEMPGTAGELGAIIKGVMDKIGTDWKLVEELKGVMVEEGLVDVQEKLVDVPYGKIVDDEKVREAGVESFLVAADWLTGASKNLGVDGESLPLLDGFRERCDKEMKEYGVYTIMYSVWGRKPI